MWAVRKKVLETMSNLCSVKMKPKKSEIEEFLKKYKHEKFTQKEIADSLDISEATVSRWVSVLKAEGKIKKEKVGSADQLWWVGEDG